jgi:hypothetical protein
VSQAPNRARLALVVCARRRRPVVRVGRVCLIKKHDCRRRDLRYADVWRVHVSFTLARSFCQGRTRAASVRDLRIQCIQASPVRQKHPATRRGHAKWARHGGSAAGHRRLEQEVSVSARRRCRKVRCRQELFVRRSACGPYNSASAPDRAPLLGPALKRLVRRDALRRAAGS